MKKLIRMLLVLVATSFFVPALAVEGESIVFNPMTGNYLITYQDSSDGVFEQITFVPSTKINPLLKSKLKLVQDAVIHYGYALTSGQDSQQEIEAFRLDPVSSVTTNTSDIPLNAPPGQIAVDMLNAAGYFETPTPWRARMAYSRDGKAFRISWSYKVDGGLPPGKQAVFGFDSHDLPSIIQVQVTGYAPNSQEIPGEILQDAHDGAFGQQYTELVSKKNFVPRNTAVPTIPVPTPFDAAVLLDRIQTQMHTWIGMQLLDATFSSQLDRYFQSAISAYRLNQPKVGKKHIQTMRELIKKEQPDADREDVQDDRDEKGDNNDNNKRILIDKLAARILDFDLKYVMKRMGGDKGD